MENIAQNNNDFKTLHQQKTNSAPWGVAPEFDPSEPPEPLDPDPVAAFLRRVLPDTGPYAVRGVKTLIKRDDPAYKARQANGEKTTRLDCDVYVSSIEKIVARSRRLSECGTEAYFTVASFRQGKGPKAGSNIREL